MSSSERPSTAHLTPVRVEREGACDKPLGRCGVVVRSAGPAEECAHAAPELADRERLRDVVVRAELEPEHRVELVVAGGQHDDRHRALCAQSLADLEPVELRQHDVEHDEVDRLLGEPPERLLSIPRRNDSKAVAFEWIGEEFLNRVLVVDEEDGRGVGHSACLPSSQRPSLL